jgi:hypothetical protein
LNSRNDKGWRVACAVMLLASVRLAHAEVHGERVTLRGFGTLAVTTHDAEGIEYRRHVGQSRGISANDPGIETDSIAGLQLNAKLSSHFDLVVQGVTRMDVKGDWTPRMTQAFLRYSPDESLVFRGGRFGFDIYLLSESRQVGYSYVAVRPSQDFYGLVTNDEVDGLDISWTARLGRGLVRTRVFGGHGSDATALADGTYWEGRSDVVGLTIDYSFRALTARAALLEVEYGDNPDLAGLGEALVGTGAPRAVVIGRQLVGSEQSSRGLQLGMAYDDGPLQAQLLYGHILSDSISGPAVRAWLGQVGYRVKSWTPFISHSRTRDRDPIRTTDLPDIPELQPLNYTVQLLQENMRATQRTTSVGVRWDISPGWDFKVQADFAHIDDSVLNFDRRLGASGPVDMTVLTAGVDFVF